MVGTVRSFVAEAGIVFLAVAVVLSGVFVPSASASWIGDGLEAVGEAISGTRDRGARAEFDDAVRLIAGLKAEPPALALAATVSAQGHWTFANRDGVRFTAANKDEIGRVYRSLAPDIVGPAGPVVIYVTGASVFAHPEHLELLPREARLSVVAGSARYRLHRFGAKGAGRWFAEVRDNVFVDAGDADIAGEILGLLRRDVADRSLRVLGLDPAGPASFAPVVRMADGKPVADVINPAHLISALSTLRRQTAVLTGRLVGDETLIYRTPTGVEQSLALGPLRDAAAADDINLVFVNATAPRQPGARNWLWLAVEVDGLARALQQRSLGDFLNAVAGGGRQLFVTGQRRSEGRVALRVIPMRAGRLEEAPGLMAEVLSELVAEVTASVVPHAVDADLVSMARQRELAFRVVPGVPAVLQYGFGVALVLGLIGLPVALRWWHRLWPREQQADYANAAGYRTAQMVRGLFFVLLFLPLVGLPAAVWGGWLVLLRRVGFERRLAG